MICWDYRWNNQYLKGAKCIHYEIEIHSLEEIDKNNSPSNVTFLDENEDLYKKQYISSFKVEEMCSSVESMKEKLMNILRYRSVDNSLLSTVLIDIMDLSSDVNCSRHLASLKWGLRFSALLVIAEATK